MASSTCSNVYKQKLQQVCMDYDKDLCLKRKQEECLEHIFSGRDTISNLPTGYGKSLIFHLLPGLLDGPVLVISPLNIIQDDQLHRLQERNIRSCRLDMQCSVVTICENGLQTTPDLSLILQIHEHYDLIFCHPEALFCTSKGQALLESDFSKEIKAVVVDECHKIDHWSADFRKAYKELSTIRSTISLSTPVVGLSGTLTTAQLKALPGQLGMVNPAVVSISPDRPNITLNRLQKPMNRDITAVYESIYIPLVHSLYADPDTFPVTLLYMPLQWASAASAYCAYICGVTDLQTCRFATIFSSQSKEVVAVVTAELKKPVPRIRLVFCTSAIGMGFDSCSISRVIHAKPPRNLSDYFQEVSRAGRGGQAAEAVLHFKPSDISHNLKGIKSDIIEYCKSSSCLRVSILANFGFEKDEQSPTGCKCCSICKQSCECDTCFVKLMDMVDIQPMDTD